MLELLTSLKSELLRDFKDILPILKSFANEKRFLILILLLDGPKSFQYLLNATDLQKTALSNHVSQLIQSNLLNKPNFGQYQLQPDGITYLRTIYQTWKNSLSLQEKRLQKEQERGLSSTFLNSFFHPA